MKLLFCGKCHDMFKLQVQEVRMCKCQAIAGKYIDNRNAIYFGDAAVLLGIDNRDFAPIVRTVLNSKGKARRQATELFTIGDDAVTITRAKTFKEVLDCGRTESQGVDSYA